MVADFAYYHLNNLSAGVIVCMGPYGSKTTKADDKEYSELRLVDLQL